MFPNNLEALEEDSIVNRLNVGRRLYKNIMSSSQIGPVPTKLIDDAVKRGKALTSFVTENPVIKRDFKQSTEFITKNPVLKFIYRKAKTPWLSDEQRKILYAQRAVIP
jgi:hypothetical protein